MDYDSNDFNQGDLKTLGTNFVKIKDLLDISLNKFINETVTYDATNSEHTNIIDDAKYLKNSFQGGNADIIRNVSQIMTNSQTSFNINEEYDKAKGTNQLKSEN